MNNKIYSPIADAVGEERRRHERRPLRPNFGFVQHGGGEPMVGMMRNLSAGGAKVEIVCSPRSVESGAKLRLHDFPDRLTGQAGVEAEVVWAREDQFGVRFLQAPAG